MQGDHKEQNGSHSLNRWKERLALQHRHAEMSTGSKPCILRGILSKGPQALMTRLGPSHNEGPGTQPTKIVSEFSVRICYIQYYNAFNRKADRSIDKAVAQCYQSNMFCINRECSIERKTIPSDRAMALILSMYII